MNEIVYVINGESIEFVYVFRKLLKMAKKQVRGGKRDGAGRPHSHPEGATVVLTARVPQSIVDQFDEPKPAYNTVSTIVRIMEKKGFVAHHSFGKSHQYFPLVSRDEYKKGFLKRFVNNYFSNSFKQMVSFFSKDENLSIKELEEMMKIIEKQLQKKITKNFGNLYWKKMR